MDNNSMDFTNSQNNVSAEHEAFKAQLNAIMDNISKTLETKNLKYGNSALKPLGIFSKTDSSNSILIRLDDKLGRIKNGPAEPRKNDIFDLIGYLTLYSISKGWAFDDQID